ncbi:MAG: CCA tRNA nucleotidyltransferase, partial [Tritonibacter mobilis]|nr:CCA tRNA nucleotidyltransferase [Tritonibacter mobilis]
MKIDQPWLTSASTRAVCDALIAARAEIYFVGGCVRNALLQEPVSDLDLSTNVEPERVVEAATIAGLKAIPTGIDHGTVTVVAGGIPFEITTFRKDVATDGRRAVVAFATDIAEDARRRDFTMNALYARPNGEVVDPLGGLDDLRA